MEADHQLTPKQSLIGLTVGGVVLALLFGPALYKEVLPPLPPVLRILLIACIPPGLIVGLALVRVFQNLMGIAFAAVLFFVLSPLRHVIPKSVHGRLAPVAERRVGIGVIIGMFGGLIVVLLAVFRNPLGVFGGLLGVGALLGIPLLLHSMEQWVWRKVLARRPRTPKAEPGAPPNGGLAESHGNSAVSGGPPSVS